MYSLFLVVLCTSMHLLFFCPSFSLLSLVFSLSNVFINKATMLTREAAFNLSLSLSLSLRCVYQQSNNAYQRDCFYSLSLSLSLSLFLSLSLYVKDVH